jgi:SHS2 domain-containing protein
MNVTAKGYEYAEDIAIADVAFHAWGRTLEELFVEAAKATTNCMVKELRQVKPRETREVHATEDSLDMLLFDFLQEIIYYKDAEHLLLAHFIVTIFRGDGTYTLSASAAGEYLDPRRHNLGVDVKAVTLHKFEVVQSNLGWSVQVILDI